MTNCKSSSCSHETPFCADWVPPVKQVIRAAPHPWDKRRTEVIEAFAASVKEFLEPYGYTAPWVQPDYAAETQESRLAEIAQIEATQDLEIAPEWARLAANGVVAVSLNEEIDNEDAEETTTRDDFTTGETDVVIDLGRVIAEHRRESFLRQSDEQKWLTTRPDIFAWVTRDDQRGLVPKFRSTPPEAAIKALQHAVDFKIIPSFDAIAHAMALRAANQPALRADEIAQTLDELPDLTWDTDDRSEFFEAWELEAHPDMKRLPYPAGIECPADNCFEGIATDREGNEEECQTCEGTGYVRMLLGADLPAYIPFEFQESFPGHWVHHPEHHGNGHALFS